MTTHLYNPARVLAQSLVNAGVAGQLGPSSSEWTCYLNYMPDGTGIHDNVISVYDTQGRTDGRLMGTGQTIDHPGFQIRIRGTQHQTAYGKAKEVIDHLDALLREGLVIGSDSFTIQAASRTGRILPLGPENDAKRRHQFTVNGTMTLVEEPAGTYTTTTSTTTTTTTT